MGCNPDSTFDEVTSIEHFSRHLSKMKLNVSALFGSNFLKVDTNYLTARYLQSNHEEKKIENRCGPRRTL